MIIDSSILGIKNLAKPYLSLEGYNNFCSLVDVGKFNGARYVTESLRKDFPKNEEVMLLDALITDLC